MHNNQPANKISAKLKILATLFQVIIVLFGALVLTFLLWEPHLEGRNVNATAFEIYFKDPFLAYVYVSSLAFFTLLYKTFKSLEYVKQNKTFSQDNLKTLHAIKYSAIIQSFLIAIAGIYIRIFHAADDDPAGFMALCILAIIIFTAIAFMVNKLEKKLRNNFK